MAQDIRDLFRNDKTQNWEKMDKGHEKRFEARLDESFPNKKSGGNYFFLKIAAMVVVVIGIGLFFFIPDNKIKENPVVNAPVENDEEKDAPENQFQLSDISPEFKKVEDYYMANINMELSKIELNETNKTLIDAYMAELEELNKEYQRLNNDFKEAGPNEQTVEAMIINLQMRLDLLFRLKNKLNELKQNNNGNYENLQA